MKEHFEEVEIPDPCAEGVDSTFVGTFADDEVSIRIGVEHLRLTPDEARAIGRALIAAADHIQHDGAGILAGEALELWELAQKLQEAYHEGNFREDVDRKVSAIAALIVNAKLERFRNRPRTVNYDLPEDNS